MEVTDKIIWLVNHAAMPPQYEVRIQTLKRATYLSKNGFKVYIISGSYLHNTNINLISDRSPFKIVRYSEELTYIHIKTNNYRGNGFSRVLNLISFYLKLFHYYKKFEKPDLISVIAAIPFSSIIYFIARSLKSKLIVDVVDLWPESFVSYGLIKKNNILLKLFYSLEYWLYQRADILLFSMEGGIDYLKEKKWLIENGGKLNPQKVFYINNGVDIEDFDYNKINYIIQDDDLEDDTIFRVIYVGSIRHANNVVQLVEAARLLLDISHLRILIYGEGEERNYLEQLCVKYNIYNVIFKQSWVEIKYIPYILSKSSLNILNYKNSSILRFGGSQSKLFQYMASGRPIVANVTMNFCPITKYKIGIAHECKNPSEYADMIRSIINMDKNHYQSMCINARNAASMYDYKILTKKFIEILNNFKQ